MKEFEDKICHVEISTDRYPFEDSDYVDIYILFKDGPLEGRDYKFDIPKKDLEE